MKKTICLNMIVKNEAPVIKRCLESVKKLIDYWVIVDTGSTDGTQTIIQKFLKDIPGELFERPWVDFGTNRNEAMQLAKGKADYLLFIDADDRLVFSKEFVMPPLGGDAYIILQRESFQSVFREHYNYFLIKSDSDFEWHGVLHECLVAKTPKTLEIFSPHVFNDYINDGARSKDPEKIPKDIVTLKNGIEKEPNNPRYPFYLARTYWSVKDYAPALEYFKKRVKMEGDPLEIYYSLLYIGLCQQHLKYAPEIFIESLSKAHIYRPSRAESLYELTRHYTDKKNHLIAYFLAEKTMQIPKSTDTLFVEAWVHDWGARLYFFINAFNLGYYEQAFVTLKELLGNKNLPKEVRDEFKLDVYNRQLKTILRQKKLEPKIA